jgi:hypothetical protein
VAETLDLSIYVKRQDDGTAHLDLAVEGIDCAACIDEIEGGLCRLPGILDARRNCSGSATGRIPSGRGWLKKRRPAAPNGC